MSHLSLTHREASLTLDLPVDRVVRVVDDASHTLRQPRRVKLSSAGAKFYRSMNLRSDGTHITLEFRPVAADRTLIVAWAEPEHKRRVLDYGQGAADLRALLTAIEREHGESVEMYDD